MKSVIYHECLASDSETKQTNHAKPKPSQSDVFNFSLKSIEGRRVHVQDLCQQVQDRRGSRNLRTTFRNHSTGKMEELSKKDMSTPTSDCPTSALLRPGEGPQKLSVAKQVARLTRYSRGFEEGLFKLNPNVFIPMESEELASKLPRPFPLVNKVFQPPLFSTQQEE